MEHEHRFDHRGRQLAGIIFTGVYHRVHCFLEEGLREDITDAAREEFSLQTNRLRDILTFFSTSRALRLKTRMKISWVNSADFIDGVDSRDEQNNLPLHQGPH